MEAYSPELTSPPVPLVALCGKQLLLRPIADYLRTQHAPRVHSIGIEGAHSAAGAFGVRKATGSSTAPPAGILKAGWLRRHRTQRPAVAAVLVERDAVAGDPSAWAWLVSQLDAIKAAVKSRGARIVVVVAVPAGAHEVPEDRMAMLCRQAGADRRCVLTYCPSEGLPALQVVGRVLYEQAVAFYAADAQRRLAHHAHRNLPSLDLNLRTAFKLGALAEFRADWATALRMYSEAYSYVPQLLAATGALQPQRFAEVRAVAEHVHVKAVSLLLLALKQVHEAVAQFEAHLRLFRRLPFQAQPGLLASHHAWICRQHMVMAELLVSCGVDISSLKREQQLGQLYLSAGRAAIERRKVAAFIAGMHGGKPPAPPGQVEPGPYVGQLALLPTGAAAAALAAGSAAATAALAGLPVSGSSVAAGLAKRLTEEQFEQTLQADESGVEHSKQTVDLLRTAADALRRSGRRTAKTLQHCMLLLGEELLEAGEAEEAERLLAEVAGFYRRERWEGPLASALLLLRECRQHSHDLEGHTELSLEAAALAGGALDEHQRAAMATAAASVLVPEPPLLAPAGDADGAGGEPAAAQQAQRGGQSGGAQGMHFSVASPHSGWLTVLPLCTGFFDPLRAAQQASSGDVSSSGTRPAPAVRFGAAFWSNAPIDLPLASAEVQLSDALGSFTAPLSAADDDGSSTLAGAAGSSADLALPRASWLRLTASIPARCSGELSASAIVLHFGDTASGGGSSITFRLPALLPHEAQHPASPASPRRASQAGAAGPGSQAPAHAVGWLRGGWAASQAPFSLAAGFLPGQCRVEVPPQHFPPLLALQAPESLLQGEQAAVVVTVQVAADAVHGAVLAARALHVESQQELGLLPLAGSAGEPHTEPALDSTEGGQPAAASSPGAQPGEQLGGSRVPLGELLPGQLRQLALLLDARYRGTVELAAELQYSAAAHGGKPEAGHCTASLSLPVQLPWRLGMQLLGPPATHTLLAAPPPAAAGGSSVEGGGEGALLEQQRRLQSLSVADSGSGAVAAAGGGLAGLGPGLGPGDARDLPLLLLRGLPPRLVLPAGQRCALLVQLQCLATCQLDVLDVGLEPAEGVAAAPAVPAGTDDAPAGPHAPVDTLNKSDVLTAAFSLVAAAGSSDGDAEGPPSELPSLGCLRLRWRRHQRRPPLLAAAARGASQLSAAAATAALASVAQAGSSGAVAEGLPAAPACEVLVPLPAVACLLPLLTAGMRFPPTAVAGQPAELQLQLHNASGTVQEVGVVVGDPHGFLLAGPKSTTVQLLPRSSRSVSWQAVPYHTGLLRLPEIVASSAQHAQQVEVTRGCSVFVDQPVEHQRAPAAAAGPSPVAAGVPSLI